MSKIVNLFAATMPPKSKLIIEDSLESINGNNFTAFPIPVNRGCSGTSLALSSVRQTDKPTYPSIEREGNFGSVPKSLNDC